MSSFEKYIEIFDKFIAKKKELDKIEDFEFVNTFKNKIKYLLNTKGVDKKEELMSLLSKEDLGSPEEKEIIVDYILLKKEEKIKKRNLSIYDKTIALKVKSKKRYRDGKTKYYKYKKKNKGVYLRNDKEKRVFKNIRALKAAVKPVREEGQNVEAKFIIFGDLYFQSRREIDSNIIILK